MPGQIKFDNGESYERMMGRWSRLAGQAFLDWVDPRPGLRWLDVGCGNGAFTQLIQDRCAPSAVHGIDPSPAQLDFARKRPGVQSIDFRQGDAERLPFTDGSMDACSAALVLFFLADPARGVAEMARVTAPGGIVCAYLWDIPTGLPHFPIIRELRAAGMVPPLPPSASVSEPDALRALFADCGLEDIEMTEIEVERVFDGFDDWWETSLLGTSLSAAVEEFGLERIEPIKQRLRAQFAHEGSGPVTRTARANAIKATKAGL